jgi:hypothetical protein
LKHCTFLLFSSLLLLATSCGSSAPLDAPAEAIANAAAQPADTVAPAETDTVAPLTQAVPASAGRYVVALKPATRAPRL